METDAQPGASSAAAAQAAAPARAVIPRWIQLVGLPLLIIAAWIVLSAASLVVVVFTIAAILALVLHPIVRALERTRVPRPLGVFAVYIGLAATLVLAGILLVDPARGQVGTLRENAPSLTRSASNSLDDLQQWLDDRNIAVKVKGSGNTVLKQVQRSVVSRTGDVVSFTGGVVGQVLKTLLEVVLILVISIYMLLHARRIDSLIRRVMPGAGPRPADDYPRRVQRAVFSYVRGQVMFSSIMGLSAGVALWVFGVTGIFPDGETYAIFFGAFFFFMEFIPYLGPVLGAAPPVLVALFQDPLTAVWVVLLFIALQQLEGHVVAPLVFGQTLRINPLLVIFALLLGFELYGIVGALLALPLASVLRETVLFLREHTVLERWPVPVPVTVEGGARAAPPPPTGPAPEPTPGR